MAIGKSRLIVVVGVSLGLIALGTATASASTPRLWTVSAGSDQAGAKPQFGGANAAQIVLADINTSQALVCYSSSTKVDVAAVGSGLAGNHIAKVSGSQTTWNECGPSEGPAFPFTVTSTRFWDVNALTYHAADGTTAGNVNNVHLQVFSAVAECEATIQGAVGFQYFNDTQTLALETTKLDRLVVTDANCGTAIKSGDFIYLSAPYTLSAVNPKNNPLVITHP